jgi:hypothetical protein
MPGVFDADNQDLRPATIAVDVKRSRHSGQLEWRLLFVSANIEW